ncbi:MAG: glycine zipper domain-containing protein [Planctomycetota bacterium]
MIATQRLKWLVLTSVATCLLVFGNRPAIAQTNQQRGATLGGLAGAVAGGLIGDHNDEAGAGAAIGGVVGAFAGGILGNAADKEAAMARQRAAYYQAQQRQFAQQQQAVAVQSAVTLQDVIQMSRTGLSDQVIINQVRQRGFVGQVAVADIIALHQQGVTEPVITTLQSIGNRQPAAVNVARPSQTVIERNYYQPAPVVRPVVRPVVIEQHVLPHYPPPYYRSSRRHYYYHR